MCKVIKRNGEEVEFNSNNIYTAIIKAMRNGSGLLDRKVAIAVSEDISEMVKESSTVTIHEIEDRVHELLSVKYNHHLTAKAYEGFRAVQAYKNKINTTDEGILGLIGGFNKETINENSNKNATLASTQRDLIAGEVSKDIARRLLVPAHLMEAHDAGLIHIHDMDYIAQKIFNCCLINLKDMFAKGTVINERFIRTPRSFRTACTIMTQIIAQVASGQYGGQTVSASHLAPYLRVSENKIRARLIEENKLDGIEMSEEQLERRVQRQLAVELRDGVQTIQYQINTLLTTNGQSPFITIFMYINEEPGYERETAMIVEEIIKQRYEGMPNSQGVAISPAFPKIIYVLDDNNAYQGSKYFHITELAAKCVVKRLMPDFISAKKMRENYDGEVFGPMGCRSFLSNWINPETGKYEWYGRFNCGVVTLNLPDVALSAGKDMDKFWEILEQRCDLIHEALQLRIELIRGATSGISPIHWQHGAISRLSKDALIDEAINTGKCTITFGYIGIHEMCQAMLGQSNTSPEGKEFGLKVMQFMNNKTKEWKEEDGYAYGLYGTPAESTTYTFAKKLRNRFGIVPNVTDELYITNSYHVNVKEPIDAFEKIEFESHFQKLSSGGAISYVEIPHMFHNQEAVITLIQYMYETIQYCEINTKSDFCQKCGFDGEILVNDDLEWYCPQCMNKDKTTMNVVRRTCGYIGENFWSEGRTAEIKDRVVHLD